MSDRRGPRFAGKRGAGYSPACARVREQLAQGLVDRGEGLGVERDAGGRGVVVDLLGTAGAPTIAEATLGWRSTHARASWAIESPAPSAIGAQPLHGREHPIRRAASR